MTPVVLSCDDRDEYWTEERCHILELSNLEEDPAVSIARARVAPGVTTRWHRLIDIIERYVVVSGSGMVEVGDLAPRTMRVGDVALIPAGCRQRIKNVGVDDLVFLAICSPRFRQERYEDAETDAAMTPSSAAGR